MAWTEERTATLKKLWAEGLTASQIARVLGGVTRNAVLGKAHREGLNERKVGRRKKWTNGREKHREQTIPCQAPENTMPPEVTAEVDAMSTGTYAGLLTYGTRTLSHNRNDYSIRHATKTIRSMAPGKGLTRDMMRRADKDRARAAAQQVSEAERDDLVALLDLTVSHCRWPIGEPVRGFCGHVAVDGGPYCSEHHAKAYSPTRRRLAAAE